jgi:hypothetical protein
MAVLMSMVSSHLVTVQQSGQKPELSVQNARGFSPDEPEWDSSFHGRASVGALGGGKTGRE